MEKTNFTAKKDNYQVRASDNSGTFYSGKSLYEAKRISDKTGLPVLKLNWDHPAGLCGSEVYHNGRDLSPSMW